MKKYTRLRAALFLQTTILIVLSAVFAHGFTDEELLIHRKVEKARKDASAAEKKKLDERADLAEQKESKEKHELYKLYAASEGLEFAPQFSRPHLRRTPADLLSLEGGTLAGFGGGLDTWLKDTKGAQFSYTDDFEKDEQTWNAQAALLWPLIFKTGQTPRTDQWSIPYFGLLPSVALHRVTTDRHASTPAELAAIKKRETDELTYRLGFFAPVFTPANVTFVVRANGFWQTDTGHEASTYGLEAEIEPLWQSQSLPWLGLGYFSAPEWARKEEFDPNIKKTWDKTWLAYQARLRGRILTANVEQDSEGLEGPSVTRGGFTAELNLNPFILESLTASISWTYLAEISGQVLEESSAEVALSWAVVKENLDDPSPANDRKISLDLAYKWGNVDILGTQKEDILTLSVGVLF